MDLTYLSERRKDVLEFCGKTEDDMKEYLDILKEWMKKQPHIPSELLGDQLLEQHIIKNKFSIEKTKTKIENYCTMKNKPHIKYLFEDFGLIPSKESQFYIPMRNLTDDLNRVLIGKIWDEEKYDMKSEFSNIMVLCEIFSRYDYSLGEIFIVDMTQCSFKFVTKLRANILADASCFMSNCISARIKEAHFVGKFGFRLVNWVKPLLPSKIASRVSAVHHNVRSSNELGSIQSTLKTFFQFFAHENAEMVSKLVPAKCLPKDYGGEQKSLKELTDDFDGIYSRNREKILEFVNTRAREELRLGGTNTEEMQGTFKKLNID